MGIKKSSFLGTPTNPIAGTPFIISAIFKVYSSDPFIYSLVPSIGSINQKTLFVFFTLRSTVSSEIIGIDGVCSFIAFVNILFTSISPFVTGELSSLICI